MIVLLIAIGSLIIVSTIAIGTWAMIEFHQTILDSTNAHPLR